MSRNLIRLNSNSPTTGDQNNFYKLTLDRTTIDLDFNTGNLKVKDGYVASIITGYYI